MIKMIPTGRLQKELTMISLNGSELDGQKIRVKKEQSWH